MKGRRPWHPVLFAALPLLFLYAHNVNEVALRDAIFPLAVMAAAALGLQVAMGRVLREPHRAAVLLTLFWAWFFGWGMARDASERVAAGWATGNPEVTAAGWLLVFVAGAWLVLRTRRSLVSVSGSLNLVAVVLVGLQLLPIAASTLQEWRRPVPQMQAQVGVRGAGPTGRLPNIYYLVLDSYTRADVLREEHSYDNGPFLDFLRSRDFYVADQATTNYDETALTLASLLNMQYLDELAKTMPRLSGDRKPLSRLIKDSRLCRLLRARGYRLVNFSCGQDLTDLAADEQHHAYSGLNEFERLAYSTTIASMVLVGVLGRPDSMEQKRQVIRGTLASIPSIRPGRRPVFVFGHVLCPHAPYVFLRDGSPGPLVGAVHDFSSPARCDISVYRRRYAEQLHYLNILLRPMIDKVLATAGPDAVIIMHGDHGSRLAVDLCQPRKGDFRRFFGVFCALHMPRAQAGLYPSITPINITRLLARTYLGEQSPPLPDENYYTPWLAPYNFTRVTPEPARRSAPAR